MSERVVCQAHLPPEENGDRCRNGFPQTAPCVGVGGGVLPYCLNEKFCGRLYPETGKPPERLMKLEWAMTRRTNGENG